MNIFLIALMLAAPITLAQRMPLKHQVPEVNPEEFSRVVGPLVFPAPVVGRIEIEGNNITHEGIIRRELAFGPGDTLTPEAVEETRSAILSTGAFGSVEIKAVDPDAEKSDVVITVAERRYPLPYPIVGIDASTGFYLGAGALYPNLFGRALHVDVGGEIGFRFSTPRWKGYTYLGFPLTHSRWHGEQLGYTFTYFWRKDAEIYRIEHRVSYEQTVRLVRPLTASLEIGFSDTIDRSVYFKPTLELDLRDDASYPTKGVQVVASYLHNPGYTEGFQTQRACSVSVAGYLPLGERTVLAGNVFTYQQIDSIPRYRTVYIGKDRFLRGWKDTTQVGACLSVSSMELRYRWLDFSLKNLPLVGSIDDCWWAVSVSFDIAAIHEPGLPPFYLADVNEDPRDGLLAGAGIGLGLGLGKGFVGKLELVYGVGSGTDRCPLSLTVPAYFGWRF
jgi:outer membrane protein assembly factor BamA